MPRRYWPNGLNGTFRAQAASKAANLAHLLDPPLASGDNFMQHTIDSVSALLTMAFRVRDEPEAPAA